MPELPDITVYVEALRARACGRRIAKIARIVSGIGNAYSDEILHRARLSPVRRTSRLSDGEIGRCRGC